MFSNCQKKEAFTLIELMVSISLIAILATLAVANFYSYLSSTAEVEMVSVANSIQVAYYLQQELGAKCRDAADCIGSAVLGVAFPIVKSFGSAFAENIGLPGVRAGKNVGFRVDFSSMNCGVTPSSIMFELMVYHCDAGATSSAGISRKRYRWVDTCGTGITTRGFEYTPAPAAMVSIGGTC